MAARLTPDQKVGSSNVSALISPPWCLNDHAGYNLAMMRLPESPSQTLFFQPTGQFLHKPPKSQERPREGLNYPMHNPIPRKKRNDDPAPSRGTTVIQRTSPPAGAALRAGHLSLSLSISLDLSFASLSFASLSFASLSFAIR